MVSFNGNFSRIQVVSNIPPSPPLSNQKSQSPRPFSIISQETVMIDILKKVFSGLPSNSQPFQIAYHRAIPCELSTSRFRNLLEENIPEELKNKIQVVFTTTLSKDSQFFYDFIYFDEIQKNCEEVSLWKMCLKNYGNMLLRMQSIPQDDLKLSLDRQLLIKRHVYPLSENNPNDYIVHIQHRSPPLIKSILNTLLLNVITPQVAFLTSEKQYHLLLKSVNELPFTSQEINFSKIDSFSSLDKSIFYDVIYCNNLAELALIKEHLKPTGVVIFNTNACQRPIENLEFRNNTTELLEHSTSSIPIPEEHSPFVKKCCNLIDQNNVKVEAFTLLYDGDKFEYVFLITHIDNKIIEIESI